MEHLKSNSTQNDTTDSRAFIATLSLFGCLLSPSATEKVEKTFGAKCFAFVYIFLTTFGSNSN